ncbi:MAG: nitrile hydratase subunit beta [Alphaproteobacteria bacterium]|nr:nitrile hydratase subunit beta [Alphaproteobacteria bacterium]
MTRGHHDLGGRPAGSVPREEHVLSPWEKEVDAIRNLLGDKKRRLMTSDELRLGIESLSEAEYNTLAYYDRWIESILTTMERKGVLTRDEFARKVAAVQTRPEHLKEGA